MSSFWLFKTEPGTWSWAQQWECGAQGTFWNGVRNHLAKKQMQAMQMGDRGFFYHSVNEKQIVGVVEVIKTYYPDPTDLTHRFGMVDIKAILPLPRPVPLAQIKADPHLSDMVLVNNSRLSVQPVTPEQWHIICALGDLGSDLIK